MTELARTYGPSILSRQHFQIAYVTNDMERALRLFDDTYGIDKFFMMPKFDLPTGGQALVGLAWAGNVNIEIIEGSGNPDSLYERHLPAGPFALAFHHFGYRIDTEAEWRAVEAGIAAKNLKIAWSGADPSGLDFIYTEAPGLGHYLEFIWPRGQWIETFDSLPRH